METVHGVLIALAERYSFADVAALVETDRAQQLCACGQRLLDLDAEDFDVRGEHIPDDLSDRALECRMPQSPREAYRGALGSLRPAHALLLEEIGRASGRERREI